MTDAAESVSPEETCPKCLKPRPHCVCDQIVPIDNRVMLLVLQHPQEQDKTLGTARVVVQSLKNAVFKVGLCRARSRLLTVLEVPAAQESDGAARAFVMA